MFVDEKSRMEELIKNETRYFLLLNGIVNTATLNYNDEELTFNDDFIRSFLKAVANTAYQDRLDALRTKKGL